MASTFPFGNQQRIVGRQREQEHLRTCLDMALDGHGGLVLVSGEVGIGKTTLIEVAKEEAVEHGMLVLGGGCYDLIATPPYGPWIEMLSGYGGEPGPPLIPPHLDDASDLEQIGSQEQLFRTVADFFSDVSSATPLLLILEDLHWSDRASVELLRYLARQLSRQPIAMITSYRDEELDRAHPLFTNLPLLVRETRSKRLELHRFSRETLHSFVENQYSLIDDDVQTLTSYLLEHTQGNPLFTVEIMRSLEQEHVLSRNEVGWQVGDLSNVVLPPLVVQIIERQLTTIDSATRGAIEVAAVLGHEIRLDLWQQLIGTDDEALTAVIDQALIGRIIEQLGSSRVRFRHALIRDVLYRAMLFPRRRQIHQQVAELLSQAKSPVPDAVASHFQHVGDRRAARWLIRAGDRAAQAWSTFAAMERYEAALKLLEEDDSTLNERGWLVLALAQERRDIAADQALASAEEAQRIATETHDDALAAWALWVLGESRFFVGENDLPEMERGLAALRSLPPAELDELPTRFRRFDLRYFDSTIAVLQSVLGHYRRALETADTYLETAPPPKHNLAWNEWARAEVARAHALCALGHPDEASLAFRRTKDAYHRANHARNGALNATTELQYVTLVYQADQLAQRRQLAAEVESLWAEASGVTTQIPARFGLLPLLLIEGAWDEIQDLVLPFADSGVALHYIDLFAFGVISRSQGEMTRAWQQVEAGIPGGPDTEPGSHDAHFGLELYRLAADLALDDADTNQVCRWIRAFDRWLEWSGRIPGRSEAQLLWTRYHLLVGDKRRARQHAERALKRASNPRQPLALIAAHRLLGDLATQDKRFAEAEEHLQESLTLAEACTAPFEQAETLLVLAELYTTAGKPDEAWQQLDRVRAICTPLEATPTLRRATDIGAKLSVRRGQPVHPAGLTPREVEVLQLVASGMTNAEIGEALYISPRTVAQHLRSVYNKLGVSSRAAATRLAVEHRLL